MRKGGSSGVHGATIVPMTGSDAFKIHLKQFFVFLKLIIYEYVTLKQLWILSCEVKIYFIADPELLKKILIKRKNILISLINYKFSIIYSLFNDLIILFLDYRNETASILLPDNQTIIHVVSYSIKYYTCGIHEVRKW